MPRTARSVRRLQLALSAAFFVAHSGSAVPPRPRSPISLVVLIAVDQLRPDYLFRFAPQLAGGLGRLSHAGAFFPNGRQDHAITATAPGHSTLLSGRFPAHTGIVTNERGVTDTLARLLDGVDDVGASPRRFLGTTLFDWMRAADPAARVLSVSWKDRGAILPVGRAGNDVYWYAGGRFTTSRYYADSLPAWVRAYNGRRGPARLAGAVWDLLLDEPAYPEEDSVPYEGNGQSIAFPHQLPADSAQTAVAVGRFPWMDSLTLDFALDGLAALELGRRTQPDLLSISLSALDNIGHDYGPDSRELHDHVLRLDRWLGWFLDSLAATIPREQLLIVLTADHGMMSYPERMVALGQPAGRLWFDDVAQRVGSEYAGRFDASFDVAFDYGLLMANVAALAARGIDVDSLAFAIAREVRQRPGIRAVYTPRSLRAAPESDLYAGRWRRSIPAGQGWLIAAVPQPNFIWAQRPGYANHGTPSPQNVTVPIAFVGPGIPMRVYRRVVRTVDIGPTLAALLGVLPTEPLDGGPIPELVRAPYRKLR